MQVSIWMWALFGALVLGMLAADLLVNRRASEESQSLTLRSTALWSGAWIGLGLAFGLLILALYGTEPAVTYLTAYLLEKSLSLDNVFVFVLIFGELGIPLAEQRRVLYWGILGALMTRGLLIAGGIFLLQRFHWVIYPLAVLIILAAVRLVWGRNKEREMVVAACNVCTSWVARIVPITPVLRDGKFWIRQNGRLLATPLLVALVIIETTDIVFALDSVPAVFGVTREPFLVYTSNVFAMLGLRSLYFLLAGTLDRFRYLDLGLAAILTFAGGKMLLSEVIEVPNWISLLFIATAITIAVIASVVRKERPGVMATGG